MIEDFETEIERLKKDLKVAKVEANLYTSNSSPPRDLTNRITTPDFDFPLNRDQEVRKFQNKLSAEQTLSDQLIKDWSQLYKSLETTNQLLKDSNYSFLLFLQFYKELETTARHNLTADQRLDSQPTRSSNIEVSLNLILDRFNINSFNLNIDTKEESVRSNMDLLAEAKSMAVAIEKSEHNSENLKY